MTNEIKLQRYQGRHEIWRIYDQLSTKAVSGGRFFGPIPGDKP